MKMNKKFIVMYLMDVYFRLKKSKPYIFHK